MDITGQQRKNKKYLLLKQEAIIMKYFIDRINIDESKEFFEVTLDNLNNELQCWWFQEVKYNKENETLTFYMVDFEFEPIARDRIRKLLE